MLASTQAGALHRFSHLLLNRLPRLYNALHKLPSSAATCVRGATTCTTNTLHFEVWLQQGTKLAGKVNFAHVACLVKFNRFIHKR